MLRTTLVILLLLILGLFFASMAGTSWLKQPFSPRDDVMSFVAELDQVVSRQEPNWQQAEDVRLRAKNAWEAVRKRIQFAAEKDDLIRFGRTIDELKASIAIKDLSMAKHRIELLRSIWVGLR